MPLQQIILSETIVGEDSSNPLNVVYHESSGHLVIDYSKYYERIAIATEQLVVATEQLSTKLTEIESHQQKLRELGEGNGIHIVGPWEWLGMSSIVKLYEEKGVNLADLKAKVDAVPKST